MYCLVILIQWISSFLHTRSLLVSYTYVSIESIGSILLSPLALNTIFLISLENTLCFWFVNLCCGFSVIICYFYECFMIFSIIIYVNFIFLRFDLIYFQVELVLKNFIIFKFKFFLYDALFCVFCFFCVLCCRIFNGYIFLILMQ